LTTKSIRWPRLIWTVLVTLYFINFFKNLFHDALDGQAWMPVLFFASFTLWMAFEYYFRSPFFQSGVVEPPRLGKTLFALFYYPFLGYCVGDNVWWHWTQFPGLYPLVNLLGVALFLLGAWVRLTSLRTLLRSPSGRFVRSGLFRTVRHPRYLGTLLQLLAVPLVFTSWLGLLLALVIGLPLIALEIRTEESGLERSFREEFNAYRQSVPALIPRLSRKRPAVNG